MASRDFIILLAAVAVFIPAIATATRYWVGDKDGWKIDYDYQTWAKDKVFRVGDTLIFVYQKGNDSVHKANQTEFQQCIVSQGKGLTTGHDEIKLSEPGKTWFISGAPKHCSEHKQKLAINVMEGWGAPAPSPMTPWTPATPSTPVPVSTPGSPGNSAHGNQQASKYQVSFVAALTFAAFLMA